MIDKEKIELAKAVLKNEACGYYKNKELIEKLFKDSFKDDNKNNILLRLTVIDSFYSTNMQKKYFAIEEIARELIAYNIKSDDFKSFIKKGNDSVKDIFEKKYGFGKPTSRQSGAKGAWSLISKYAYFLTGKQFPIYDKFVKDMICPGSSVGFDKFINHFREKNISDYDGFDNYAWLCGKIKNGSMYLVLGEQELKTLFEKFEEDKQKIANIKSKKIDTEIANFIRINYSNLFPSPLKDFIDNNYKTIFGNKDNE